VRYLYDTEEQLTGVVNQRGETYRLKRDALGRITEEIDYWGQSRHYHYDAGGRITRSTDPLGRSISFATDALGRITQKTLPDWADASRQVTERFKYDKAGRLIELKNAASHVQRRFDPEGRLIEEDQNGFKIENRYDALGNRRGGPARLNTPEPEISGSAAGLIILGTLLGEGVRGRGLPRSHDVGPKAPD
jgi:YD repeat-containing protein